MVIRIIILLSNLGEVIIMIKKNIQLNYKNNRFENLKNIIQIILCVITKYLIIILKIKNF